MKSRMRLEKHPPMSFDVFGPVQAPDRVVLEIGKHGRALALRASEVTIDIVHVDEQPVDDPRDRRPLARGRARLPVMLRALVVRCRGRQEDPAFPESQLRVRDPPVAVLHPLVFAFMEPEGTDQPIDRRGGVLVRAHRHDRGHLLPLVLRHLVPSTRESGRGYLTPTGRRLNALSIVPRRKTRQILLRTSAIRWMHSTIVSRDAAYERRRWPSPASPNTLPGVTATFASWRSRSASVALSIPTSTRGKT